MSRLKCRNVQKLLRDEPGAGTGFAHREAEEHARSCTRCAAAARSGRALREAMRNLAVLESTTEAPGCVEESVRMAFRRHFSAARVAAPKRAPLRLRMALAAAFIAGLLIGALTIRRFLQPPPENLRPTATVVEAPATPQPATRAAAERSVAAETPSPKPEAVRGVRTAAKNSHRRVERRKPVNVEIMTDFIPLTYTGTLMEKEGAQLMRVQMSRSALISLGVPIAVENAYEPVKADVLFGNDGVARAIRFVR